MINLYDFFGVKAFLPLILTLIVLGIQAYIPFRILMRKPSNPFYWLMAILSFWILPLLMASIIAMLFGVTISLTWLSIFF